MIAGAFSVEPFGGLGWMYRPAAEVGAGTSDGSALAVWLRYIAEPVHQSVAARKQERDKTYIGR